VASDISSQQRALFRQQKLSPPNAAGSSVVVRGAASAASAAGLRSSPVGSPQLSSPPSEVQVAVALAAHQQKLAAGATTTSRFNFEEAESSIVSKGAGDGSSMLQALKKPFPCLEGSFSTGGMAPDSSPSNHSAMSTQSTGSAAGSTSTSTPPPTTSNGYSLGAQLPPGNSWRYVDVLSQSQGKKKSSKNN
jgi:hypothetical protein